MRFVIIHARGPNGKLVRSYRAIESRTGATSQGSPAHRLSIGSSRQQQLEAHGLGGKPEEDGGSAERAVGEGEARLTTLATHCPGPTKQNAPDSV
jgi:hypothetical protein